MLYNEELEIIEKIRLECETLHGYDLNISECIALIKSLNDECEQITEEHIENIIGESLY